MKKLIHGITLLAFAAICCGCMDGLSHDKADSFSMKGVYESAGTKSLPFAEGDAYHIYAFRSPAADNLTSPYIDSPATETSGVIEFPGGSSVKTLFGGLSLDFYGVTLGEPGSIESSISNRIFHLTRTDGHLKDLRRAKLEGMSSVNSGDIILPFRHALTKLNFTITRQDVDELREATLESISIWDYDSGSYDIIAGEWTDTAGVARNQVNIFSSTPGKTIMTDKDLKDPANKGKDKVDSCLVFPRPATSGSVNVNIRVRVPHSTDPGVKSNGNLLEVNTKLYLDKVPGGNGFQQNHEYALALAVVNDNIKIIMVVPTMYDWIDGETGISGDIALGHPITFGGVTWADRNLGAESASYNNVQEWDRMRGYFYQYGRSIPYFVLPTNKANIDGVEMEYVYTPTYGKTNETTYNPYLAGFPLINSTSKQDAIDAVTAFAGTANYPGPKWKSIKEGSTTYYYTGQWPDNDGGYPLGFYSEKSKGKSLAYESHEWEISGDWNSLDPSEKKAYAFVQGQALDEYPWWIVGGRSLSSAPDTWYDKEKNPCPKGWKVPSRDDWAGIMPLSKRTGDITFMESSGQSYTADEGLNSYYDYIDINGVKKHQFVCKTGKTSTDVNQTYVYHNATYKNSWKKTQWFDAGIIYDDDDLGHEKPRLWWHEVGGQFAIDFQNLKEDFGDPTPGYISHYLCIENKHDSEAYDNAMSKFASCKFTQGTLYAIKCQGTAQAYRLRWRYLILSGSKYVPVAYRSSDKYPVVLEICRYPALSGQVLECPQDLKQWDDWDNPTETMVFPIGGYLFSEAPIMTNNAMESVYAAADHDSDGYFYYVRLKHSTNVGSRYLMLFRMRRAYGMSVRCVKDNTVTLD